MTKLTFLCVRQIVCTAAILLAGIASSSATTVRMQTSLGAIDVQLMDAAAPATVANFLNYVASGAYNNSFIHRSMPGFVIQGGGFRWNSAVNGAEAIPGNAPVINEFSSSRSNLRGTIAMAKLGGDPNSATNQWFFNLGDNAANLDNQNGGFTVFGQVTGNGMQVVDAIAALPMVNAGSPFDSLPVTGLPSATITAQNLVMISSVAVLPAASPYTGLWWNADESGWGMSVTQHGNMIFAAVYTYDASGQPAWYVMSSCPVSANGCSGTLYRVVGASSPLVPWNGAAKVVSSAGSATLSFSDASNGTLTYTLNGLSGAKTISRQIFATGSTPPAIDYSDLWWNANESGWGLAITQEFSTIFATWYAYDNQGNPTWYVASNCPVSGNGCSGDLYQVSGGSPLTSPWNGANKVVGKVGSVSFSFADANNGTLSYTINGVAGSRAITRQSF